MNFIQGGLCFFKCHYTTRLSFTSYQNMSQLMQALGVPLPPAPSCQFFLDLALFQNIQRLVYFTPCRLIIFLVFFTDNRGPFEFIKVTYLQLVDSCISGFSANAQICISLILFSFVSSNLYLVDHRISGPLKFLTKESTVLKYFFLTKSLRKNVSRDR